MIARRCIWSLALASAACNSSAPGNQAPKSAAPIEAASPAKKPEEPPMSFYSLQAKSLDTAPAELAGCKGKVTLVVNVASECGYTPQYAGLQKLHDELKDRGFAVLGFPSNDFGAQEPGDAAQIRQFCTTKYKVGFPLFAKVQTKEGEGQSPIYTWLQKQSGKLPNWNFCKYLVGKDGNVIGFYNSKVKPDDAELRAAIEKALAQKS